MRSHAFETPSKHQKKSLIDSPPPAPSARHLPNGDETFNQRKAIIGTKDRFIDVFK